MLVKLLLMPKMHTEKLFERYTRSPESSACSNHNFKQGRAGLGQQIKFSAGSFEKVAKAQKDEMKDVLQVRIDIDNVTRVNGFYIL